ncbi:alpha/beta fold hydrolase [Psychromarinibacter sp. C21-152]|uniref:Alpha/beta fold hydrolase n=1 Tax=Psychromarinibacter sediminicola TaxID=3033385 RepID=A0AAE3NL92_9RHOB|nr:alpha/beta fold hydrolase [Psychromarinibacter sediminicola]MDF0599988.1 alpha/beta fold hydrolase [Psychromarinibacter sediminicola]
MPLLRVNAVGAAPALHGAGDLDAALRAAAAALPPGAPVIVLVHGYKYAPSRAATDPHRHIFSLAPPRGCWKTLSWPRHLGFGRGRRGEGLCIAFGWEARGSIWSAWGAARDAGIALAETIARLRHYHSGPVDMVAHSLGARVCLAALRRAPAGSVGRMVLMAAAEFRGTAATAMAAPAGRTAEVLNITTRENDLFDAGIEWVLRPPERGDRTLGEGLRLANWLDIQIDAPATRRALERLGFHVPPPKRRVCHWAPYLRPGLLLFYAALLRDRDRLSLPHLRRALPASAEPRWARLRPARAGSGAGASHPQPEF